MGGYDSPDFARQEDPTMLIWSTALTFAFLFVAVPCWGQTTHEETPKPPSGAAPKACCSCLESLKLVLQSNVAREIPSSLVAEVDPEDPNGHIMTVRPGKKVPSNKFQVLICTGPGFI